MKDIYSDKAGLTLKAISQIKELPEFVKSASLPKKSSIRSQDFADPYNEKYPCCDPATTYTSFAYHAMEPHRNKDILARIVKKAQFFEIGNEITDFANRFAVAKQALEKSANDKISHNGMYPISEKHHVRLAEETFSEKHKEYPVATRQRVAEHIIKRAEDLGVKIHNKTVKTYGFTGIGVCRSDQAAVGITKRAFLAKEPAIINAYKKIGNELIGNAGNPETLNKVVETLEGLDKIAGIREIDAPEPYSIVYNLEKEAAEEMLKSITLGDKHYPMSDLLQISPSVYEEALGDDFLEELTDENGVLSEANLMQIIPTLPLDEKRILKKLIDQNLTPSASVEG